MEEIDRFVQIKSNNLNPERGRLLISEPFMGDEYFGRSVVLLAEHNEEGSFGVVLNKSLNAKVNEVLNDFPPIDSKIFLGGPVDTNSTFYIHTLGNQIDNSLHISNGLFWGGNIEVVKEMILLKKLNSSNIRFFIGYSGWNTNQLQNELKQNSWLVHKEVGNSILKYPVNNMWTGMVNSMGPKYKIWTKYPIDPNMN
jgi:putative transcriptional regulator